jgi:hypothetical protein
MAFNLTTLMQAAGAGLGAQNEGNRFAQQQQQNEQALQQAQQKHALVQAFKQMEFDRDNADSDRTFDLNEKKHQLAQDKLDFDKTKALPGQKPPTLKERSSMVDKRQDKQQNDIIAAFSAMGAESQSDIPGLVEDGLNNREGFFSGVGGGTAAPDSTAFKLNEALQNIGSNANRTATNDSLPQLFPERFPNQGQAQGGQVAPQGVQQSIPIEQVQAEKAQFQQAQATMSPEMKQAYVNKLAESGYSEMQIFDIIGKVN